ncbi:MAG: AAA family ATPase, partial [Mucispirillum sp.]|nr:AAA family ATPase [Mucispirillum sp.]
MKSYVIWNNKGGIGKTMLSFLLSTEYALLHPDENIVVIDMCPQANVSQVILGGSDNINAFNEQAQKRHTVADYFINRYEKTPFQIMGIESEFYIQPKEFNDKLPDNLFLTVGSPKLEILNPIIDILTNNGQPVRIGGIDQWKAVYNWINDLKTGIINKIGENTIFFIDTNPSFANYTKIAIL